MRNIFKSSTLAGNLSRFGGLRTLLFFRKPHRGSIAGPAKLKFIVITNAYIADFKNYTREFKTLNVDLRKMLSKDLKSIGSIRRDDDTWTKYGLEIPDVLSGTHFPGFKDLGIRKLLKTLTLHCTAEDRRFKS